MLFNDKAQFKQLQSAAQYWQASSPINRDRLNAISMMMFGRPYELLSTTQQNVLQQLFMAGQNIFPGALGNPGEDFATMNRAVASSGIPAYFQMGFSDSFELSTARGTGNLSYAVTQQILMAQEMMTRQGTGGVNLGITHGLTQSQWTKLSAMQLQKRGIQAGDVMVYNLSDARTADALDARLEKISKNNPEAGASLEMARYKNISQIIRNFEARTKLSEADINNMSVEELTLSVQEANKDNNKANAGDISAAVAQLKGDAKAVAFVSGSLRKDIHEANKAVAENIAILTDLFKESDPGKIEQYARGLGFGSTISKGNVGNVRASVTRIQALARMTGSDPFEIVSQQAEIAQGWAALNGGRHMSHETIVETQRAGIGRDSEYDLYTKDEYMQHQMRSAMNAQSEYAGFIRSSYLIKRLGGMENLSESQRAEVSALMDKFNKATGHDEAARASEDLGRWAVKVGGRDVLGRAFTTAAAAEFTDEAMAKHKEVLRGAISEEVLKKYNGGIDRGDAGYLFNTFFDIFGGGGQSAAIVADLYSGDENRILGARAKLERAGVDANKVIALTKKYSQGDIKQLLLPLVTQERFSQYSGTYNDIAMKEEKMKAYLDQYKSITAGQELPKNADAKSFVMDFLDGLAGAGGVTKRAALEMAYLDMDEDARLKASEEGKLVDLGEFDNATNELTSLAEFKSGERKLEGISLEEIANLDTEQFIALLQNKGYEIAQTRNGNYVAGSEEFAKEKQKEWQEKYEKAGAQMLKTLGYTPRGGKVRVGDKDYDYASGAAAQAAMQDAWKTAGRQKLLGLSESGDEGVSEFIAGKVGATLNDLAKEEGGIIKHLEKSAKDSPEAKKRLEDFKKLQKLIAEKKIKGHEAVQALLPFLENIDLMGMDIDEREAVGAAKRTEYNRDKVVNLEGGGSITKGQKLTEDDIDEQREAYSKSKKLIDTLKDLAGQKNFEKSVGDAGTPNLETIEKYLKTIAENTTPSTKAIAHPGTN